MRVEAVESDAPPRDASTTVGRSAGGSCEWIKGCKALQAFAPEWDALFELAPHASYHMARPWCEEWSAAKGDRAELQVLCIRQSGEVIGALPLRIRRIAGVRIALPAGAGRGAYLGVLIRNNAVDAPRLLARELTTSRRVDLFINHDVSSRDVSTIQFYDELEQANWAIRRERRDVVRCAALRETFEQFLNQNKSAKSRKSIRYRLRTLHKKYDLRVERYTGREVDERIILRCSEIHENSWMKRRGGAFLCEPFYQKLIRRMAEHGLIKAWIMTLDGEDAAFSISGVAHGVHYYEWPAFKEKFESPLSVGQTLMMDVMADACASGESQFDFGHGDGDYKRAWSNEEHSVDRVLAAHGLRGLIAIWLLGLAWTIGKGSRVRKMYRRWKRRVRKARQQGLNRDRASGADQQHCAPPKDRAVEASTTGGDLS